MADPDFQTETIPRPSHVKRILSRLNPRNMNVRRGAKGIGIIALLVFLTFYLVVVHWSNEPDLFDVKQAAEKQTARRNEDLVTGYVTTSTLIMVASKLLERHQYKVVTAKDGVDALAQLEDVRPDVMLLDIEMPRMDGFELATHMQNESSYSKIPIIMITSRTGEKHRDRALEIGVTNYMGKPYQEDELIANIQGAIAG